MNQYITGSIIKKLREERGMTQADLSRIIQVSDKTVSKWETGKGYPDISLIAPLSKALGISVGELLTGADVTNNNISANMLRTKFYVCPVCGNIIHSTGEVVISCHGITLSPLVAEAPDEKHTIMIEDADDEYFVSMSHEMTKEHYISFFAAVSDNRVDLVKLYPEGNAQCYFKKNRVKELLYYCNQDGLYAIKRKDWIKK